MCIYICVNMHIYAPAYTSVYQPINYLLTAPAYSYDCDSAHVL